MKCAICRVRLGTDARIVVVERRIVCWIHTQEPAKVNEDAIKSYLERHVSNNS